MFDQSALIWRFLSHCNASSDPVQDRIAKSGRYAFEVFPALAVAAVDDAFRERLGRPRYRPDSPTFRLEDWEATALVLAKVARDIGCDELANWAASLAELTKPRKLDQDALDAAICAVIAAIHRFGFRHGSAVIGDMQTGYMVVPLSEKFRTELVRRAEGRVPIEIYEGPKRNGDFRKLLT